MDRNKTYRLVITALLTALTCVATMVIKVPTPVTAGYVNLGDTIVLLCGWVLGPAYGFFAAGVGSALADLLNGYASYVPGTLIIKGLMAVIAWGIASRGKGGAVLRIVSGVAAETAMVLGYFAYESTLLGYGAGAAASIPANGVQGVIGLAVSIVLYQVLRKTGVTEKFSVGKKTA